MGAKQDERSVLLHRMVLIMAKERAALPKQKTSTFPLSMKDLTKIIGSLGLVISLIAWVHAEFTVPKILNSTAEQIRGELDEHSKYPHPVSASRREIELMQKAIENSIDGFKTDTHQRLTRIEDKLDRL